MISRKTTWLKASGICGILTPIIAFTCILLAISYSPSFSWTQNALSDLGIQSGTTAPLFNYGLISSGIIALIFASGLFSFLGDKLLGKIGAAVFTLAVVSLTAIGVFPESVRPTHFYVSVAFFMLFPISMLLIVATFLLADKKQLGWFTFMVAMIAAVPWVLQFTVPYVENVAIPETISAVSASMWAIALGYKMIVQSSRSNK
ncbi:MAG TPA: DUF998 domain-containing protein [Candidatus Bathyarchaeia archaeon]|nr:DUF998 domain-containing protein [Candidatus Bathyarchaeia archaeon]